jgi:hypothetical protein
MYVLTVFGLELDFEEHAWVETELNFDEILPGA